MSADVPAPPRSAVPRPQRRRAGMLGNLRVGEVLGTGFTTWLAGLPVFLPLTAILYVPFAALSWWIAVKQPDVAKSAWYQVTNATAGMLLSLIVTATLVHAVFRRLRGKPISFVDSLEFSLGRLPAILLATLLTLGAFVAILLPFLLLGVLVPPLMPLVFVALLIPLAVTYTGWWVVLPVCVVERQGAVASMSRSWHLTRGSRFAIFVLMVILMCFGLVVGLLSHLILTTLSEDLALPLGFVPEFLLVSFQAVMTAVGYHELRLNVEGLGADELAAIFD